MCRFILLWSTISFVSLRPKDIDVSSLADPEIKLLKIVGFSLVLL